MGHHKLREEKLMEISAKNILRKLLSRKFLTAAAGILMGIVIVFGGDSETVETVAGAVVSLVSTVAYIAVEGRVDALQAANCALRLQQAADIIGEE